MGDDTRILVPCNLEEAFPWLHKAILGAARNVDCTLVPDKSMKMKEPAYLDFFSLNEEVQERIMDVLESPPKKKDYAALQNLVALIESLGVLPTGVTGSDSTGRIALLYITQLVAGIWIEQTENIPMSESSHFWRTAGLKTAVVDQLALILGDKKVSECIVQAVNVIYRKYVRAIVTKQGLGASREFLGDIAEKFIVLHVPNTGGGMLEKVLPRHSVKMARDKDGKVVKPRPGLITHMESYLTRPIISDGPMTEPERILRGRINTALGKLDTLVPLYKDSQKHSGNVRKYFQNVKSQTDNVREAIAAYNHIISGRKALVRSWIDRARDEGVLPRPVQVQARGQIVQEPTLTLEDWEKGVNAVRTAWGAKWIEQANEAYHYLLQRGPLKEGSTPDVRESDVVVALSKFYNSD